MQNQRGHGNLCRYSRTGCAVIIVIGAAKAGVASSDLVVELAQGRNPLQAFCGIDRGKKLCLYPKAPAQAGQKFPLVDAVGNAVQRVRRDAQVHGRGNTDHGFQVVRGVFAQFARQLQHQVAAHGVANQGEGAEAFLSGESPHHRCNIGGEPGMIQRR